ncbi:hypothetical protein HYC85_014711 [Camellia sinensis]|uniref:Terpene synthase metal-binding domain-containing protein n=1 Tax=Camellia sinensis TaxID=4442 RepID=A0A7J7HA57_CAMSI|nr:hypothetical protein HYC85_014711 [Camellia sinensis]
MLESDALDRRPSVISKFALNLPIRLPQMVAGRIGGLNLTGRKMKTWLGSGTLLLKCRLGKQSCKELPDSSKDVVTLQINYLLQETIVECYFWMLDEPQYFLARKILFRVTALTSIIDDIYDVYGTLEEHVLFTDAVERWEISALDQLPEYMNLCYQALLDI